MINPRKLKIIGLVSHREILANGENGTLGENVAVHSKKKLRVGEMVRQAKTVFLSFREILEGGKISLGEKNVFCTSKKY
jgi:hypothetical protein